MKVLLFGQIGAGKSFLGRVLARECGLAFHEGDDDLTPAMHAAIAHRTPFSIEMRLEFTDILATRIETLARQHDRFCVAQGLFKNTERHRLRTRCPDLRFVLVQSSPAMQIARLRERADHVADLAYAEFANPHFEAPDFSHHVIFNDSDDSSLLAQFREHFKSLDGALIATRPAVSSATPGR